MLLHNLSMVKTIFKQTLKKKKALTSMQPHVDFQGSLGGKVESTHVTDTTLHRVVCLEMCV